MKIQNTIASSYYSTVRSTQAKGFTHFSCLGLVVQVLTFNVCMKKTNELSVSHGVYTIQKMLLLFYFALYKCFIYSRVKAYWILHGAKIPVAPTKNQAIKIRIKIQIHLIRKKFFPFRLFTTYPQEKSKNRKNHSYLNDSASSTQLLKKIFLPIAFVTDWKSMGM